MSQSSFSPNRIRLATLAVAVAMVVIGYVGLTQSAKIYEFAFPILLTVCLVGIKWAAPAIPFKELLLLVVLIFGIAAVADWAGQALSFPLLSIAADKAIEVLCVLGFGARWVKRGYIPQAANYWPS